MTTINTQINSHVPTFAWLEKLSIQEAEELLLLISNEKKDLLAKVIKERILLLKDKEKYNKK